MDMHRLFSTPVVAAALAAALASAAAVAAPPANVEHVETFRGIAQYRLKSNGMTILLVPTGTWRNGLMRRYASRSCSPPVWSIAWTRYARPVSSSAHCAQRSFVSPRPSGKMVPKP